MPHPDDYLPVISLDKNSYPRVADDLLLPEQIKDEVPLLEAHGFSRFGPFATSVQATYLYSLVIRHLVETSKPSNVRKSDAAKLDATLSAFTGACIPPPTQAKGFYCAAFSIRAL
jgi:hypothetical protein